jgi:hypothetical protein
MSFGQFGRGEIAAAVGGLLLAISIFLPWYATSDNPNSQIDGARGALSAWAVHDILRWLLLAAAAAPIILLWIVFRDHELSWPRGEMTAVVAMIAIALILYVGFIDRPGRPSAQISLQFGWFVALLGAVLMLVGGATRASGTERPRKPPGVL